MIQTRVKTLESNDTRLGTCLSASPCLHAQDNIPWAQSTSALQGKDAVGKVEICKPSVATASDGEAVVLGLLPVLPPPAAPPELAMAPAPG